MPSNFKLPPDYKKHAITFLSPWGKEKLSTQDNLFEAIQRFERRFVVDTHIDWLELSACPENANTAFILGMTMDHETWRLQALVENPDGSPKVRQNVFQFGYRSPPPKDVLHGHITPQLIIARLDAHRTAVLDMDGLRRFDQQASSGARWDTSDSIADEKTRVLKLLGISRVEELDQIQNRREKDAALRSQIERERPKCFKDFWKSNDVARCACACLLLCSHKGRSDFTRSGYSNLFGDCHLIQNALFLNAGVLSRDTGVKQMAKFCHVVCMSAPRNK